MLHLYYFESLENIMAIGLGYEFSPNMIGIQEDIIKTFIKTIEYMRSLSPCIRFEI
jgi:hypothetical protein